MRWSARTGQIAVPPFPDYVSVYLSVSTDMTARQNAGSEPNSFGYDKMEVGAIGLDEEKGCVDVDEFSRRREC